MGLVDQAFSVGGDLVTGWLNNQYAEDRQADAQNFSARQYATRYQTTVKDMQAAGLNPMLAYTQGVGNSPGGVVGSSNATPSLGSSLNQSSIASAQSANIRADTVNKEAQTENIQADTILKRAQAFLATTQEIAAGASADASRANVNFLEMQAKKISEEIKNIPTEGARLRALVQNLQQEYKLIQARTGTETQAANQMKWLAVKTMLESDLVGFDVQAAKDLGNLGREAGQLKPVIDALLTGASILGTRKSSSTVTHRKGE